MKFFIPLLVLIGLGAAAWSIDVASTTAGSSSRSSHGQGPESQQSATIIYAAGRVEGTTEATEILPEIVGRTAEIVVREGDVVKKGDLLIRLDDETLAGQRDLAAARVAEADAELTRRVNGPHPQERIEARALVDAAVAQRNLAQRTWERIRELRMSSAVTQQNADEHSAEVHAAEAALAAARARLARIDSPTREDEVRIAQTKLNVAQTQLALAETELAKTRILAPISGTILKIDAQKGELIGPAAPRPAVVMADTSRLRVRAFVEELDAPRVVVGMSATITADGLPDREFRSRVTAVSPTMTEKSLRSDKPGELFDTKVREVWLNIEGTAGLVNGLRVDVTIACPGAS